MADELDELKALFRSETPIVPREAAKRLAIAEAEARYQKKILESTQGLGVLKRLTGWVKGNNRSRYMHQIRVSHMLMAGASLAAISLVVVNANWDRFRQQAGLPVPETVAPPPPKDVAATAPEEEAKIELQAAGESRKADEVEADAEYAPGVIVQQAPAPKSKGEFAARSKSIYSQVPSNAAPEASIAGAAPAESMMMDQLQPSYHDQGRDKFTDIVSNPVKVTAEEPVSTFSIDVDTASYAFVRASLNNGVLPQKDAVRVEEMINYFPYDYPAPADKSVPFKPTVTVMPTPWNANTKLMHIGIKGFTLNGREKPKANLVFLLDTSGSMEEPNKLPLLRNSMKLLVDTLGPEDTVSIVTYAGNAGTVLAPTKAKEKGKIIAALDNLNAGGSTAGAEGIRQAYQLAEQNFDQASVNRVILATDGDFNVGITDPEELKSFVERKRDSGIYLSVLGFGRGNYNDELMQTLAQNGNGNAAYIDTLNEARKVLVEEATSTLFPIAKDVKIQVEFNPQTVSEYRLIGYETRLLNREDFNNDKVDAGDIGSGHTVTAIYEIAPKGSKGALVDPLRYGEKQPETSTNTQGNEYAFLKIRYKLPGEEKSNLISEAISPTNERPPSTEARFSVAVAAFGQLLRGAPYTNVYSYDDIVALALGAKGQDEFGFRAEFISLLRLAKTAQGLDPLKP
jgi:Ca-activated chloride channel family protein